MAKQKKSPRKPNSKKVQYKVRNWSEYNESLKQRGSLEIWIDEKVAAHWYYAGPSQRGAQFEYSDKCIEMACVVKEVYGLGYRQTEGFLRSLVKKTGWEVKVPDYTVINRRRKKLDIKIAACRKGRKEKLYIVVDSTGIKVYGEGEWKVRQHGWSRRRTWRKIHLAIDENTGEIESCGTTTNSIADENMVNTLLDDIKEKVYKFAADGAYDKKKVHDSLQRRKIKAIIPPRKNARIGKHGNSKGKEKPRDKIIRKIRKLGRKKWKKKSGYHRRSIAESTMFRYKNIFGGKMISRDINQQEIEVKIKCKILNRMIKLGMPDAYPISKVA
jgi:hypothetical protein